jgi:hypothetical protein
LQVKNRKIFKFFLTHLCPTSALHRRPRRPAPRIRIPAPARTRPNARDRPYGATSPSPPHGSVSAAFRGGQTRSVLTVRRWRAPRLLLRSVGIPLSFQGFWRRALRRHP